jgi:hypothetical protein
MKAMGLLSRMSAIAFRVHFKVHCINPKKKIASGSIWWLVRMVVTWPISKNGKKIKVVALHCSFQNLFGLYPSMSPLWRYEVKDYSHCQLFSPFCIFLHEHNTKQHDFNIFRNIKERATIIISWENWPKKEGAYPKRDTDTDRLQKITDELQNQR